MHYETVKIYKSICGQYYRSINSSFPTNDTVLIGNYLGLPVDTVSGRL